jgi:hypothetical protein
MTEPFTLTSRISANEFAGVSVRISLRTDFSLYIAMLLGIFFLSSVSLDGIQSFVFSSVLGLFLAGAPLVQWHWRRGEYYTLYPQLQREIEFRFFEDRFAVSATDGHAEIPWSELARLWSAGKFFIFVLRDSKGTYYVNTRGLTPEQRQFIKTAFRQSRAKR